jgi:hypothetical protein
MWIGAAVFLAFMWGMGLGADTQSQTENKIKVIEKVGARK